MTSVNPVQTAGAALIVAVVSPVEVTWSWATRTGLTTSVVTASGSSERSGA